MEYGRGWHAPLRRVVRTLAGVFALGCMGLGTSGWHVRLPQSGALAESAPHFALALDGAGAVVVAGPLAAKPEAPAGLEVIKLSTRRGERLWRRALPGVRLLAFALGDGGDPVVGGSRRDAEGRLRPVLLRLSRTNGAVRWRLALSEARPEEIRDLAFDHRGEVLAAGSPDFRVLKLRATDGRVIWHDEVAKGGGASRLAAFADGDLVLAGSAGDGEGGSVLLVTRLDGLDAAERWRARIDGARDAVALALDPPRLVVAAPRGDAGGRSVVVSLDTATGRERWRARETGVASAHCLALAPNGDVLVGGSGPRGLGVVRLADSDGAVVWRLTLPDPPGSAARGVARALAITPDGDVIAAGSTRRPESGRDFAVLKLDGASGELRWLRRIDGGGSADDSAMALVSDADGNPIATGYLSREKETDVAVLKLRASDGVAGP